jgi:hypothetical protein
MKMLLITLLTCTTLVAQSREQLIRKFGRPISETFTVRPGIAVTVTYAPAGPIAELLIAPQITAIIKSRGISLSKDSVTAIIDELVPKSERGKAESCGSRAYGLFRCCQGGKALQSSRGFSGGQYAVAGLLERKARNLDDVSKKRL